ncbi:MAG: S1 RNA-binding domain-containing protein [Bacillota bacterium]|nr:S1 RNA-binding domain-containing protein [Bacillota bacterium]
MSENVVIGNEHEETERFEAALTEAPSAENPTVDDEPTATEAAGDTSAAEPAESVFVSEEEAPAADAQAPAEEVAAQPAAEKAPADHTEGMSFADMIEQIPEIHRGATVKGMIIRYDDDNVYVDVNAKSEGRIPKHEFDATPEFDLDEAVRTHREIDVYVKNIRNTDMGKEIILSKARVDFAKFKDQVEQAYNERTPITVKVVNVVKDGVIASYGGIDIYVHRTQLEIGTVEDLEPYRDQSFDILVTQFDPERRRLRVSGSRRSLLNRERKARAEELWATIAIGDIYDGVVRSLTDFGAFVDIGGVDGLVHISELSWTRIKHPSEVLAVGDVIQVYVKDFDSDRKRISLGYKRIEDDPYHNVEERFPVGSEITGKVVRMFNFGAFVEVAPGVDALCHISQISTQRLNQPQDVLTEGQEVRARVLDVSNEARRISISIRDVEPIDAPGAQAPAAAPQRRESEDSGERRPRRGRRERNADEFSQTSYSDSGQNTTLGSMLAGLDLGSGADDEA